MNYGFVDGVQDFFKYVQEHMDSISIITMADGRRCTSALGNVAIDVDTGEVVKIQLGRAEGSDGKKTYTTMKRYVNGQYIPIVDPIDIRSDD